MASSPKPVDMENTVTIINVNETPKRIYDDVLRRTFWHTNESSSILQKFEFHSKSLLSASSYSVTYKMLLINSKHLLELYEYFFNVRVRFCEITRKENLKLWLSLSLPQAYNTRDPSIKKIFAFGIELSSFSLGAMKNRCAYVVHFKHSSIQSPVTVDFEHDCQVMTLKFQSSNAMNTWNKDETHYQFDIQYDDLDDFILLDPSSLPCGYNAYFMLKRPPHLYKIQQNSRRSGKTIEERVISTEYFNVRTIGKSSVLHLVIAKKENQRFHDTVLRFHDLGKTIHWAFIEVEDPERGRAPLLNIFAGNFVMQYACLCLWSRGYVVTDRASGLSEVLVNLAPHQYKKAEKSLFQLSLQIENDRFIDLRQQFRQNTMKLTELDGFSSEDYENCFFVRRLIVTPTRRLFMQPELAFGNRILRHFGGEYCLRVVFRDENFFKLSSFEVSQTEEISERLEDCLLSGIHLPPRHYQFLACSNSQLTD